jgi:hypothetical protein
MVKSLLLLLLLSITQVSQAAFGLNSEFIQGFETGVLSRNNANILADYSCQKPVSHNE